MQKELKNYINTNIIKIRELVFKSNKNVDDLPYLWNTYDFIDLMPTQEGIDLIKKENNNNFKEIGSYIKNLIKERS